MRYIKIEGGTYFGCCGFEEYLETDMIDEELDSYCIETTYKNTRACENIMHDYTIYQDDYAADEEYETALNEATDNYYAEPWADWKEITKEEYERSR